MPEALPELVWFALLLLCFALVYVVRRFTQALFGPIISAVSHVPLLGSAISGALTSVEESITGALASAESGIDSLMGASWHRTAELTDWLWRELKGHASLLVSLADSVVPLYTLYHGVRALAHAAGDAIHGIEHGVRDLRQLWHGIEHRVKQLERDLTKGIGHDLRLSLKADEKELDHLRHKVIPSLRAADATAEGEIGNLYDWIKGKASVIGVGTFALAVSTVLATIGNGWLGCKQNPFSQSKNPCGLWSDLARLMPLLGLLALAFDFPEFVKAAELVAEEIGPSMSRIEGSVLSALPALPPPI